MTGRYEHQSLRTCPPETLAALRAQVAALLRFGNMLPSDLYVKLDLLHGDVSALTGRSAAAPAPRRSPAFTPRAVPVPHELPASRRDRRSPGRAQDAS